MAYEAYLNWTGTSTTFKPENTAGSSTFRKGHEQQAPILRVDYNVSVPYDVTHGSPKAKRVHNPIIVLKEWGASTPLNLKVLTGNELLKTVVFSFYTVANDGSDQLNYTITLTNAHIVKIRQFTGYAGDQGDASTGSTSKNAGQYDTMELEEISFTFEKIQEEHAIAKTIVIDDWLSSAPSS
jgi:type VI secretion system Hcp family effector